MKSVFKQKNYFLLCTCSCCSFTQYKIAESVFSIEVWNQPVLINLSINCKGKHEASSKNCPSWKREKEISHIKTEKNLPYPQARKAYESLTMAVPEKSFVEAVTQGAPKKFTSVGVQTDSSSKDEGKVLAPSKKNSNSNC